MSEAKSTDLDVFDDLLKKKPAPAPLDSTAFTPPPPAAGTPFGAVPPPPRSSSPFGNVPAPPKGPPSLGTPPSLGRATPGPLAAPPPAPMAAPPPPPPPPEPEPEPEPEPVRAVEQSAPPKEPERIESDPPPMPRPRQVRLAAARFIFDAPATVPPPPVESAPAALHIEPPHASPPSASDIRVTLGSETTEAEAPPPPPAQPAPENDWSDSEATIVRPMSAVHEAEARNAAEPPVPTPSTPPIPGNPFFAPLVDRDGKRTPSLLPPPGESPAPPPAQPVPFRMAPSAVNAADQWAPPPSVPARPPASVPLPPPVSRPSAPLPPPPSLAQRASLPAMPAPPRISATQQTPAAVTVETFREPRLGRSKIVWLGIAAAAVVALVFIVVLGQHKPTPAVATLIASSRQPGVKVKIDGDDKGSLPVQVKDLAPGEHVLEFSRDEHYATETQKIVIGPNETRELSPVALKVVHATATFDLRTPGATLTLVQGDERTPIASPGEPTAVDPARSPFVEAAKTGLATLRVPLTFEEDATKSFVIDLGGSASGATAMADKPGKTADRSAPPAPARGNAPAPAAAAAVKPDLLAAAGGNCTLNLNSIPASNVVLDGRPLGPTPKVGISVTAGNHTVMFVGDKTKRMGVSCKAGEKKTVAPRL
jgi:serine/threonine-protein kinase